MISNIEYSIEKNPDQFNDDKLFFHINNNKNKIKVSFVNGIRRVIEEHMSSFILSDVNIIQNNTVFNNDILIQRLMMMPIIYNKAINYNIDKLLIKIDILNTKDFPITIKSKDIKFF